LVAQRQAAGAEAPAGLVRLPVLRAEEEQPVEQQGPVALVETSLLRA